VEGGKRKVYLEKWRMKREKFTIKSGE